MDRPVRIFLSEASYRREWARVLDVAPAAQAVRLRADGTTDGELEGAEVAWATSDLERPDLSRKFYGGIIHTPSFRWLQASGAGFNGSFFARFVDTGAVLTAAHANAPAIAEYVIHAALDHALGAQGWRDNEVTRGWRDGALHGEVRGSTWTIVGYGSIGRAVTRPAQALGVTIRGVRRTPAADDPADEMFTNADILKALDGADVVVLAAPLTPETANLADADFFAAMAPGAHLINVGRGGLVDEDALFRGLDRGTPGFASLDVMAIEPLPADHPLWDHPRVRVTPHAAGSATGNDGRLIEVFLANLDAYLKGEPMRHVVSRADVGLA